MKHIHKIILVSALFSSSLAVNAQSQSPDGFLFVYNEKNEPIPGVVVGVKGTDRQTISDSTGMFRLTFSPTETLTFQRNGYLYKEETVGSPKKKYVVHLMSSFKDQSNFYIDHFGEWRNGAVSTGAVSTVSGNDMEKYLSTDILMSLQGRIPGLHISQYRGFDLQRTSVNTTGDLIGNRPASYGQLPFSDNTRYNLSARGLSPVVIVDGVERELFSIDPEDIEQVSYEKDALSSLFLGMKSSRGALVINTKMPTSGKIHLSLTSKLGVHSSIKKLEPLNAMEYAYLLNEALTNDGNSAMYSVDDFTAFANGSNPYLYPNVNWEDELMKNSALSQSYDLNVSGGGKVAQYIVSLSYNNEQGLFKKDKSAGYNTNFNINRYLISTKVNINITRDFSAMINAIGRVIEGNQPGGSGTGYSDLLYNIWRTPNNAYPIYNPNGSYGGNISFTNNLKAQTVESGYINDNMRDIMANLHLTYDFNRVVKGLKVKLLGSIINQNRTAIVRTKQNPVYQYTLSDNGEEVYTLYGVSQSQSNSFRYVSTYQKLYGQLRADYDRQWGDHYFSASLIGDTRHEVVQYDLPMIPSNIMEQVKYNYANRYFVDVALIQSYFNRYAPGHRWGNFYAFGLGWNIKQEKFMEQATWLDYLKLRGTYGYTGNGIDNSGYYRYRETFKQVANSVYPLGSSLSNGIFTMEVTPSANPDITWEKAHKLNIGLDFALFGKKLMGTIDFYNDNYFDLLQQRGKSIALLGTTYPNENIGKNRLQGLELSLTWQDRVGNFNYYVSGNWNYTKTKLIYMDEQDVLYDYQRHTGRPIGIITGLQADGFLTAEDIANNYPVMTGYDPQPGDVKYIDQNNDGVIDQYDCVVIGGDKPLRYFGLDLGLEYKGIEFSMMWQGCYGRDLYVNDRTLVEGFQSIGQAYGQAYKNLLDRWTPETQATAKYPRLSAGGNTYNYGGNYNSSLWMHKGNYLRLKNIMLAYNLPGRFCNLTLGGLRAKIYVSAENLITFSSCDLVDPEVTFTSSPIQRCYFTGIKLQF